MTHASAMRLYFVYILPNRSGMLYTGVTNNLARRMEEHRNGLSKFTSRYKMTRLVYYEPTPDVREAILREKQIKPWRREKKLALISGMNPKLLDLSLDLT